MFLACTFLIIRGQALGQNHDSFRLFILAPAVGAPQGKAHMKSVNVCLLMVEGVGRPSCGLTGYIVLRVL